MTKEEAIEHGKEQLDIFGGEHKEFIEMAIKALEQEPCEAESEERNEEKQKDLEAVRQELLERGDELVSFRQLVERFDEIEEVYKGEPWNLEQIYSNFNVLIGKEPYKWIPVINGMILPKYGERILVTKKVFNWADGLTKYAVHIIESFNGYVDFVAWMPFPVELYDAESK